MGKDLTALSGGQDVSVSNLFDAYHNAGAKGQFHEGSLYRGTIVHINPIDQSYSVRTESPATTFDNCYYASGVAGALLGFKINTVLAPGTKVMLVPTTPPIIITVLGSDPSDHGNRETRSATGVDNVGRDDLWKSLQQEVESTHSTSTHNADTQVGELEIGNQMGVAIQLMTHFAKLSAGDRAKIEVCVLNDMVRIVSDNFKHHSAFGDQEIYNDGRLNVRFDGTSYPHEAWGRENEGDPLCEVEEKQVKFDSVAETGRWRFSQYLGWLGDFLHLFITEPENMLGNMAQNRAGHSRIWTGSDGTILIQSIADIVLERVIKVQVPIQHKDSKDPQGVRVEDFENLETHPLKKRDIG